MPFRVRRHNEKRSQTQTAPTIYQTRADAFDAAWENMGQFIKDGIRAGHAGDADSFPSNDWRFKIWVETRLPDAFGFRLVYDWPTTDPADPADTNVISWRVISV
jgi:hypothetical protein